ncbi:hypothetical protein VTJ83DRAFT_3260 [Remersonia thermophila]|uniref:J domain-containing protein n=1 Tax=Remersonia thermophila TaxID=72144 RepID=A0ABR4DEE8_9PEZI
MPLRNPAGASQRFRSSAVLPGLRPATILPTTSRPRHRRRPAVPPAPSQRRPYASVSDVSPNKTAKRGADGGPLQWPASPNPTPYEILGVSKNEPYNKKHFFRLAMHYHPDRQHLTADDGIPHLTKLERYRLVVAANELLSNPQKKRMYDLYGFGWDQHTDTHTRHREADRTWRKRPGNASMNATWEDWERWHQQRDGGKREKQEEIFASNVTFMAVVAFFLVLGTWSQMTRAGTNSMNLIDMRDQKHAAISKELQERRNQRIGLDRRDRVDQFLRQREYEKWAYDPPNHGLALPPPDQTKKVD